MRKGLLAVSLLIIITSIFTGCGANSANRYDKSGRDYFSKGNYEEAEKKFRAAIDKNPNRSQYYIDLGMALIELGKYEEAINEFDSVYQDKSLKVVEENNKRALRGKGIAYLKSRQYKNALEQFELALSIDVLSGLDMDILYYKGCTEEKSGLYKEAADTFTKIISKDENNADAYQERAFVYRKLGDYKNSLADYNKAISLDESRFEYYFNKYFLMIENGKKKEAVDVLKQAEKIKADTKEDQYNLARLHYYQEKYDTALGEFEKEFKDGFTEANYYIGEIYEKKKDYTTAIYYYQQYLEQGNILIPAAYNQMASCLIKTGDSKKALDYLKKGIEFGDLNLMPALKKNEIVALEYMGMYEDALKKLTDYRKEYPEDKEAEKEETFLKTRVD